jgi:LysM repeat protein
MSRTYVSEKMFNFTVLSVCLIDKIRQHFIPKRKLTNMRNQIILAVVALFFAIPSNAQCPSSSRGNIHVVQSGQTLYGIAKMYGTSVAELSRLNRLTDNTLISVCSELNVPQLEFTARSTQSQQNTRPVPTEYTSPTQRIAPQTNTTSYASRLAASRGTHIVAAGETLQSIANFYGYTTERMIEMNSLAINYQPNPGAVLVVSECYFEQGYTGEKGKVGNTETGTWGQQERTQPNPQPDPRYNPSTQTQTNKPQPETNPNAPQPAAASYMKSEELAMIDEINLVRSNPVAYIPYVEEYKAKILRGEGFGSIAVCDELIAELRNTPARSVLKPRECLYRAARNHGEDQRPTGSVDHVGTDDSYPWDRVLRACPELTDGNENLVGGPSTVRESVMILLIDDGIPNRGHRKTMLQKEWQYVACYKIGKVGMMPNSWVQKYAY